MLIVCIYCFRVQFANQILMICFCFPEELSAVTFTFVVLLWISWKLALIFVLAVLLFFKIRDEIVSFGKHLMLLFSFH